MAKIEGRFTVNIQGQWFVEGFEPMSTEDFAKLLLAIDAAQFEATLTTSGQSELPLNESN